MAWEPKPNPAWTSPQRISYFAGYSDGFHGYHYGAGDEEPSPSYEMGFKQGSAGRLEDQNHD